MHQSKNVKTSLSRTGLSIQVFSLCLLLMGSTLTFISAMTSSSHVFAQGSPKMSTHHLTTVRPHSIVSSKKALRLQQHTLPQMLKTQKGTQLSKQKLARNLDVPITGLLLGATKTQTTPAPPAQPAVGSVLTETITVGGVLPDTVAALLSSPSNIASFLTLSVVDTTKGLNNVRLNPMVATNANWTITSSTPMDASGLATTTFTYTSSALPTSAGAFVLADLVVDGDVSGCPAIGVVNTAQVLLSFTNPLGATGITPVNLLSSGVPAGFANPAALVVPITCALPIASVTAPLTAPLIGTVTASPTATTASPTATTTSLTPTTTSLTPTTTSLTPTTTSLTPTATTSLTPTATTSLTPTATTSLTPTETTSPTATTSVTAVPSMTAIATETATPPGGGPLSSPALTIVKVNLNGDHFKVGDKVTYVIVVENLSSGASVVDPNTITVSDVIPLGLSDIKVDVNSTEWNYTSSDNIGPALLTLDYVGGYSVAPGETLPPITITGKLTNDAVPYVTNTATVDTMGNSILNNSATDTVFVDPNKNDKNNKDNDKDKNKNDKNNDNNDKNKNDRNKNDKNNNKNKNHSANNHQNNGSGGSTNYNGSGDPTSYNGGGYPTSGAGNSALPHLPLTGGAPASA